MKWPIKAVNISGSEIKQSSAAKNSPLTTEEPTSHQKLPALYSTAISNRREPFLGSNIQRSAVHPPKIPSCFRPPHPAKLLHIPWKPPSTARTRFRPSPCVCVWMDILKELNTHRGSFFLPTLLRLVNSLWAWVFLYSPKARPALQGFPGPAREAAKPAGGMEHMSPTTWNALGQAPSRRTPTDPQEPQTGSSRLARSSKYMTHRGRNNFRFALSLFSLFISADQWDKHGRERPCHVLSPCLRTWRVARNPGGCLESQQCRTHEAVAPIAEIFWCLELSRMEQVTPSSESNFKIDFPGNLDPSAFPVKLKVHRILLKGEIAGKSTDTEYFPPPNWYNSFLLQSWAISLQTQTRDTLIWRIRWFRSLLISSCPYRFWQWVWRETAL